MTGKERWDIYGEWGSLKTHFPGSYPTGDEHSTLSDISIIEKETEKKNWKIAKDVKSERRVRSAVNTFKPMKSPEGKLVWASLGLWE